MQIHKFLHSLNVLAQIEFQKILQVQISPPLVKLCLEHLSAFQVWIKNAD